MADIGKEYAESAQRLVPVETGALKDSIGVRSVAAKEVVIGAGGGTVDYAKPVEYGAAPHEIRAVRARRLRFFWKRENRMFVGLKVNHPGNRPQPYFLPVTQAINLATRFKAEVVEKWNAAG